MLSIDWAEALATKDDNIIVIIFFLIMVAKIMIFTEHKVIGITRNYTLQEKEKSKYRTKRKKIGKPLSIYKKVVSLQPKQTITQVVTKQFSKR